MGRSAYFSIFIALLVVLHFTLHLAIGWGGAAPDLLTVAALLAARRAPPAWAAGVGLVMGVLQDALSLVAFGASAVALSALCYIGARSRDLFEGESVLFIAVYLFLGKWSRDAVVYVLGQDPRVAPFEALVLAAPLSALYAAAVGSLALTVFRATRVERS